MIDQSLEKEESCYIAALQTTKTKSNHLESFLIDRIDTYFAYLTPNLTEQVQGLSCCTRHDEEDESISKKGGKESVSAASIAIDKNKSSDSLLDEIILQHQLKFGQDLIIDDIRTITPQLVRDDMYSFSSDEYGLTFANYKMNGKYKFGIESLGNDLRTVVTVWIEQ